MKRGWQAGRSQKSEVKSQKSKSKVKVKKARSQAAKPETDNGRVRARLGLGDGVKPRGCRVGKGRHVVALGAADGLIAVEDLSLALEAQ